jgi:hypothetical protein
MAETSRNERSSYPVRKTTMKEQDDDPDLEHTTAAERLGMMWPLALDAWAFMGKPVAVLRLPRHIVRVRRRR